MTKISRLFFQSPARYLLLAAAILQLTVALGLYTMGRLALSPNKIDEHGLLISVLPDTITYQAQATDAVEVLQHAGVKPWLRARYDAHVKIYSLSYLVFGPLVGQNIIGAEPLNLGCYLLILILVARFGKEVFDQRAGRAAAAAVALWPSFLLHNAQVLKDPICVVAMLCLLMVMAVWLTRNLSWRMGLASGLLAGAAIGLIYATRAGFWVPVILGLVLIGAALLVIRQVREKSFFGGNVLSLVMVLLFALASLAITEEFAGARKFLMPATQTAAPVAANQSQPLNQGSSPTNQPPVRVAQATPGNQATPIAAPSPVNKYKIPMHLRVPPPGRTNYLVIQIQQVRDSFSFRYTDSGTLIDPEVEFVTVTDVLRYLPRAMEIGFMAPFPTKWLSAGKEVGLSGRLLSGAEMLATYLIELLALFGIWRGRRRMSTWLLFLTTLFGVTVLGLGLINVGALYRMRYGFFVLLIMMGTYGLTQLRESLHHRRVAPKNRMVAAESFS
jgi:hypothetical protein